MSRLHLWLIAVVVLSGSNALAQTGPYPPQGQPASPYQGGSFSSSPSNPYPQYPPLPTRKAYIRVFVPDDRAKVIFNDHETTSTGGSRLFETPALEVGRRRPDRDGRAFLDLALLADHTAGAAADQLGGRERREAITARR